MRALFSPLLNLAFIAPATIALASCGGTEQANEAASTIDSNLMFERIGNDASALEAAANAAPTLPPAEPANESSEGSDDAPPRRESDPGDGPVLGETSGGDTGGNTMEGNVSAN